MALVVQGIEYIHHAETALAKRAVNDVSFNLNRGEILGLWGDNGAGKTTLMKLLCGTLKVRQGSILVEDQAWNCSVKSTKCLSKGRPVVMALQYPENQLYGRTVRQDIAAGLVDAGVKSLKINLLVESIAQRFYGEETQELLARAPYQLSGGQKRCAALASVLVQDSPYIMLDEPMEGLDHQKRLALGTVVLELARTGNKGIIIASHRMVDLLKYCDRLLWLDEGKVRACGDGLKVLQDIEASHGEPRGLTASRQLLYHLRNKGIALPIEACSPEQAIMEIITARNRGI